MKYTVFLYLNQNIYLFHSFIMVILYYNDSWDELNIFQITTTQPYRLAQSIYLFHFTIKEISYYNEP